MLPLLGLLLLGAGWLTFMAFTTPTEETETVTDLSVRITGQFENVIIPMTSALYPEPEPLRNEPHFYMRLMDSLTLKMAIEVAADEETTVEGTTTLKARIIAPERWTRDFDLQEPVPFSKNPGPEPLTVFQLDFPVPMEDFQAFIAVVEEETRVMPRGDYRVEIIPTVTVEASNTKASLAETFELPYGYTLAGNTLQPDSQLEQRRTGTKSHNIKVPGRVPVLAKDGLPVKPLRLVGALAVLALLAAAGLTWQKQTRYLASLPELTRIQRRYRARLLPTQFDDWPVASRTVMLDTFAALVKVADLYEQNILLWSQPETVRLIVLEGDTAYVYSLPASEETL